MTDHPVSKLVADIRSFLSKHAHKRPDLLPEQDILGQRYVGEHANMMDVAAAGLEQGVGFDWSTSFWGGPSYYPVADEEAKALHDDIASRINLERLAS